MTKYILGAIIVTLGLCLAGFFSSVSQAAQEATLVHGKKNATCHVCGMYIERFKKTTVNLEFKDGTVQEYCGVSCAIRAINEKGGFAALKSASVTGWTSQVRVDMAQATYVIGSRIIPDMIPNIIGFASREEAQEFIKEKGGRIESLDSLLASTSYRGLTMPFRIPSAAVPGQGVFSAGAGTGVRVMNHLMEGDHHITDADAFAARSTISGSMTTYTYTQALGYGVTDDLFLGISIPEIDKKMVSKMRNGNTATFRTAGIGDVGLNARWRFWHDMNFDQHLGLYGAATLPTGEFDNVLRDKSTMQLGTGAASLTPGLLYSQHIGKFWFHAAGMYKFNFENAHDYKYGDNINAGLALHYLPNTSDLFGFEVDLDKPLKNEDNGTKVLNTGRTAINYNLVYQRKILLCLGGNMSVNALYGFSPYEKVKDMQLGEAFHASLGLQWQRKF